MFDKGSLVLIPYPFSDLSTHKKRPVLVLTRPDQMGDFCALPVTSKRYHQNSIALTQYIKTGKLPKTSWVRTDRIVTLNQNIVIKVFATCTPTLIKNVLTDLCGYLNKNHNE